MPITAFGTTDSAGGRPRAARAGKHEVCPHWPTCGLDAAERAPVASAVPTLVVTGQYDPPTSRAYGEIALATLSRSVLV